MATQREADLFAEKILAPVGAAAGQLPNDPLTGFLAIQGDCYKGDLMVIGRAVNGWTRGVSPQDLANHSSQKKHVKDVLQKEVCLQQMNWVTKNWGAKCGYNTKKSAFWRAIRGVTEGLNIANNITLWSSYLVWSNLYKLSPADAGNPSGKLRRIQLPGCRDLLQLEIEIYRPTRLLLLTGSYWADPFLKTLGAETMNGLKQYVRCAGLLPLPDGSQTRFVVACHPQGKPETNWIWEVLQIFR